MQRTLRLAPIVLGVLCAPAVAQTEHVGERLPKAELTGFANTKAKSLGDLAGRAILLEFFAHW